MFAAYSVCGPVPGLGFDLIHRCCGFYRHRIFALLDLGLPREKKRGVLPRERVDADIVLTCQLAAEQRVELGDSSPHGVGSPDESEPQWEAFSPLSQGTTQVWSPRSSNANETRSPPVSSNALAIACLRSKGQRTRM